MSLQEHIGLTQDEFDKMMAAKRAHNLEFGCALSVDGSSYLHKPAKEETIDHPPHYNQGDIECIDAIKAALTPEEFRGFCKGNSLKYVWRERYKNGGKDLEKSNWYLLRLIASGES